MHDFDKNARNTFTAFLLSVSYFEMKINMQLPYQSIGVPTGVPLLKLLTYKL